MTLMMNLLTVERAMMMRPCVGAPKATTPPSAGYYDGGAQPGDQPDLDHEGGMNVSFSANGYLSGWSACLAAFIGGAFRNTWKVYQLQEVTEDAMRQQKSRNDMMGKGFPPDTSIKTVILSRTRRMRLQNMSRGRHSRED